MLVWVGDVEVISAVGQYFIPPLRTPCRSILPGPLCNGVVVMGEAHDQLWPMSRG